MTKMVDYGKLSCGENYLWTQARLKWSYSTSTVPSLQKANTKIVESAVKGVHALHDRGIKVLVATGRASYFIKPHVFEVIDSDYYVTINGQCVMDRHHNIIKRHDLNKTDIVRLLKLCQEVNVSLGVKCSKQIVVLHDYAHFVEYYGHGEEPGGRFLNAENNPDILDQDLRHGTLSGRRGR